MAISIPALLDAQLAALLVKLRPVEDAVTKADSFATPPYVHGNRAADIIRLLTDLVNSGTLTGTGIHGAADATNPIAAAAATDQSTSNTLLTEAKGDYNAHRVLTAGSVHGAADSVNIVTAANATDLATSIALANDIKVQHNLHRVHITTACHAGQDEVNVLTFPDATDLASVIVLANEIKADYNAHIANIDAGSTVSVADSTAFTLANSLTGATITFTGNVTAALAGLTRVVLSNTLDILRFNDVLPSAPAIGDTFTVAWTSVDAQLAMLDGGKGVGNSQSDAYGPGPALINAITLIIELLGGAVPSYLTITTANPFSWGSPQAGGGSLGVGGAALLATALQLVRDTVAAYTAPA